MDALPVGEHNALRFPRWPRLSEAVTDETEAEGLSELTQDDIFKIHPKKPKQNKNLGKLGFISGLIIGCLLAGVVGGHVLRSVFAESWRERLYASWKAVSPQDTDLQIPTLSQFEASLPRSQRIGKELLGLFVQQRHQLFPPRPNEKAAEVMETLAEHLSRGKKKDLIGMELTLTNMQALGSANVDTENRKYTVTGYLGEGGNSVVLEVKEEFTNRPYALKLFTYPAGSSGHNFVARKLVELMGTQGITEETAAMLQAAGSTNLSEAVESRGLAVATGVATIKGVPTVMDCPSVYFLGDVQLMERFHEDLLGVFTKVNPLPVDSKVYAARRLMLEVMQLQRAGFSHNDLKLRNFFMRDDGSFFLGDFGSGTPIGQPLDRLSGVTVRYAEKELAIAATVKSPQPARPVVDEKSDMWSLGLCLYEIFTDGDLPYGLKDSDNPAETLKALAEQRVNAKTLRKELMVAQVPYRWQEVIIDLLQVERRDRISAKELAANYIDLIY